MAAILTSLGDRFRSLVRGRRAAVVTAAASSVLVATSAVAYYANTGSDATPDSTGRVPSATAPDFGDEQAAEPSARDQDSADDKNGTTQGGDKTVSDPEPALLGQTGLSYDEHPRASPSDDSDAERPGSDASGAPSTPTPTAPAETQPPAQSTAPPPTTADPEPSQPPTTEPPADDKPGYDDCLCLNLPPILKLCLFDIAP